MHRQVTQLPVKGMSNQVFQWFAIATLPRWTFQDTRLGLWPHFRDLLIIDSFSVADGLLACTAWHWRPCWPNSPFSAESAGGIERAARSVENDRVWSRLTGISDRRVSLNWLGKGGRDSKREDDTAWVSTIEENKNTTSDDHTAPLARHNPKPPKTQTKLGCPFYAFRGYRYELFFLMILLI